MQALVSDDPNLYLQKHVHRCMHCARLLRAGGVIMMKHYWVIPEYGKVTKYCCVSCLNG